MKYIFLLTEHYQSQTREPVTPLTSVFSIHIDMLDEISEPMKITESKHM